MPKYHIGHLDEEGKAALAAGDQDTATEEPTQTFLNPRKWKKATLHSKTPVSWDTRIFSFKLDHDHQDLGLPTGQHLMIRLTSPTTHESLIRSYTPISATTQKGTMDILVKIYFSSASRAGGQMSQALDAVPLGSSVDFKGPIGKFQYHGPSHCTINAVPRHIKTFVMICGGSGITPIYQVFRAVMQDASDTTKCIVLNGNRMLEDILCKADLDRLAVGNEHKCKIHYTLTQAPEGWEGLRGRIAAPLLKEHADRNTHGDGEAMALICGPEALEKAAHSALLNLGWREEELVFF